MMYVMYENTFIQTLLDYCEIGDNREICGVFVLVIMGYILK